MWKKLCVLALTAGAAFSGLGALVINEVCYDNSAVADETGNTGSDWIELYNSGPGSVNILNYGLGDASPYEEAKGVRLPNYTIPAGGYLVVFASSDLAEYTAWTNAPDIAVVPANTTWRYSAPPSAPVSTWNTLAFNDASWASGIAPFGYNDPKLNMDCATVLGYGGNPANRYPAAYFRKTFNLVNLAVVTGLVVNARVNDGMVLYLNGAEVKRVRMPDGVISHTTLASEQVASTLWTNFVLSAAGLAQGANVLAVEVHQGSASSVDLIMDLTVTALVNEQVPFVHGQFGLTKTGENVHLFDTSGTRLHKFDSPAFEIGENKSYGLAADGVAGTYTVYDLPTPEFPNHSNGQRFQATLTSQKPTFSVPPGVYLANQSVVLNTATAGYKIYYTLDGSDPLASASFVYSGNPVAVTGQSPAASGLAWLRTNPVEITNGVPTAAWQAPLGSVAKAVVLRAVAVSGTACSPETRGTYFIGTPFTNRVLPVVSLITDTNNLFGFTSGIYVPGKHYADSPEGYGLNKWGKPHANYHQDGDDGEWERPVQVELFETNQTTAAFSHVLGMTMHGGGTRTIPQKTLYLMARLGEYGTDHVNYALFPDEPATVYKRFLLRNSGNDWYGPDYAGVATMMKDAVFHRMAKGLDLSVMAYRPAAAYINGEYWGIHNLRESFDKHYLATRYGLDADNVDLLMHEEDELDNGSVQIKRIDGDKNADEEYEALIDWIQANPLSQSANYQQVQTWIDVTNHADYIIAETFFGNTDWPVNNCDFWRAHTNQVATCGKYGDTRWRWMLYDLDVAGEQGADFDMLAYLSSTKMTGGSEPGFLINQLWSNMDFRNHFVNRYANLLNSTFRPERLAGIVEEAANAISPEIERHFRRWGRDYTHAQWQQAVSNVLVQYTATRHAVSFEHLDARFALGGTGALTVRNYSADGSGGSFIVNGLAISAGTEGVTSRAEWSGTFFRSLPVPVQAVPDEGYVFDRWVGTTVTSPATNLFVGAAPLTLTARFRRADAPLYTVTFDAQGGAVDPASKVVAFGASYGDLPMPTRTGHAFGGWWTAPGGTGTEVTADSTVSATADHALYAKWTFNAYMATFDPQGGSVTPASKTVVYGDVYGALPTPARSGYAFGGWWTAPAGAGTEVTADTTVSATADHTLYAKWTASAFTVTFDPLGGTVDPASKVVTFDSPYGVLPAPTRTGYTFGGWQATTNGVAFGVTSSSVVAIPASHTLAAMWTANTYTVTFDPQGSTVSPASKSVTFNAAYGALPTPGLRTGYAFDGWWTAPGGAGSQVNGATTVTAAANHTLYARWTATGTTVTFDPQGGSVSPTSKAVTFGSAYGSLPTPDRSGHTFGGWWTAPGGAGTQVTDASTVSAVSNHTLFAMWTANGYTVTFDPLGGAVDPTNKVVTFDAPYGALPDPSRAGYTFGGWQASTNGVVFGVTSNSVVAIPEDHTLAAAWSTNTYTVTFDAQGGSVEPSDKLVTYDAPYGALPEPSRTGYAFSGWWTAANGAGTQVTEASTVSGAADHTLYAKWTASSNTVFFDPQGGAVNPSSKPVIYGIAYGALPTPARAGYAFGGWWTAPGGAGTQVTEASPVAAVADHTLYAKWTASGYTVFFDPQGGSVNPASKAVIFGAAYGALPTPARTGYAFGGWWTAPGGAGSQVTEDATVAAAADHTLYAKWTASGYTAFFDAQGGSVDPASKDVIFAAAYGALPLPARTGYVFGGWWTAPGGAGTQVTEDTTVAATADHTLYAKWTASSNTAFFDPQGGTVSPASKAVIFGAAYGALPTPARTGYTFGGWWTAPGGAGTQLTEDTAVAALADHTLFARWTVNGYTVTLNPQAGTVDPASTDVTYGAAYGALPTPARTGYTFGGWWTEVGGAGTQVTEDTTVESAADHTLYARWAANVYTVAFEPQGGTVDPTNKAVTFDSAYGDLPVPARAGFTFGGWLASTNGVAFGVSSNSVVAIPDNHTLAATWTTNSYTVTFDPQGGSVTPASKAVTYGAAYGLLPAPVLAAPIRVDYVFGGWFTGANGTGLAVDEDTAVTAVADHTLYAKWTAEAYVCEAEEDAPLATVGQYVGYFYQAAPFADTVASAVRGTFSLSLTKTNGTLTAKAVMQKSTLSFTAKTWSAAADADGTKQVALTIRSGETLVLRVRENRLWGSLSGGSLGGETLQLEGSRNRFVNRKDLAAQAALETYKGYYTVALPLCAAVPTGAAQATPEGSGYLTLTVSTSGKVTIAGRLADGTSFSQSSTLMLFDGCGPEACVPLFAPLYTRKGWTGGLLWFTPGGKGVIVTDRDLGWFIRWEKPATLVDGASILLDAAGGYYSTVTALASHYLLTADTNAVPYHYTGGIAALQADALPFGIGITNVKSKLVITRGTRPVLTSGAYDYSAENSAMATFSFTPKTGLFKGAFSLYYDYTLKGRLQHKAVSVPYAGVFTPVRAAAFAAEPAGQGYYLVPDNNPFWKTSRLKRSYRITVDAAP